MSKNSRILCVSDLHFPYHHPDTIPFLESLVECYQPDRIVLLGDEIDGHAMSYHESDPDLDAAGPEFDKALSCMEDLYEIFDDVQVDVIDSNHGALAKRKAKTAGIPQKFLKEPEELYDAPDNWTWHQDLIVKMSNGQRCLFTHGKSKDVMRVVSHWALCVVQGHFHTEARVAYMSNPEELLFGMNVGCSIDRKNPAFAYDSNNIKRPIIAHGWIEDGIPVILPMPLDKNGRWNGKVP